MFPSLFNDLGHSNFRQEISERSNGDEDSVIIRSSTSSILNSSTSESKSITEAYNNTNNYATASKLLKSPSSSNISSLKGEYVNAEIFGAHKTIPMEHTHSELSELSFSTISSTTINNPKELSYDIISDNFSSCTTGTNKSIPVKELQYSELDIGNVVGEGSFGTVRSAYWRGMRVAVKHLKNDCRNSSIPKLDNEDSCLKELQHESQTMSRVCNHAFIIQFIGVVLEPLPCVVTAFYANGSVEDLLVKDKFNKRHSIDILTLIRFTLETAIGVRHLHLEGVVHRDLAARNLLIDDNFHIRVADFGFSRAKEEAASKGYTSSDIGPIRWSAPEAMRRKIFSEFSDIFSLGVVMFEIFAQDIPWKEYNTLDVAFRVCSGERMKIPDKIPLQIRDLMVSCWNYDAELRPPFPVIINVLTNIYDSLQSSNTSTTIVESSQNNLNSLPEMTCFMREISNISIDFDSSTSIGSNEHIDSVNNKLPGRTTIESPMYDKMSPLIK
jgi:serine/threonine protein kinase